jgi:hypothetical protein
MSDPERPNPGLDPLTIAMGYEPALKAITGISSVGSSPEEQLQCTEDLKKLRHHLMIEGISPEQVDALVDRANADFRRNAGLPPEEESA